MKRLLAIVLFLFAGCAQQEVPNYIAGRLYPDAETQEWYDLLKRAKGGDINAQYELAEKYKDEHTAQWNKQAEKWFLKAAKKGHVRSQHALGVFYWRGAPGINMDAVKAMEWLSKAAEGGYSEALYDLGYIYEEGKDSWEGLKGIPQDLKKAEEFYLKAAERGSVSAARALVYMYQDRGEKKKAADFSFRAAELGDASYFGSAHLQMGVLYLKGEEGVKKDYNKAIESFLKAVESGGKLGYGAAEFNLGLIYFYGYGVKKDRKTAAEWMIKAAEHHELDAQVNLGYMYEHAEGVERDYLKAKEWYEKAAKRGAATAQYNLGVLYMNGSFGKADNLLGCAWVYISKNHNNKFCDPAYSNVSEEEVLKMVRKIKEENPMIK